MNVSTRGRLDLKSYFQKNDIPTESNFADLIDGMLNEKDDGLVRMPGDPLSIEAASAAAGPKKLLNFYDSFNDAAPSWSLSLTPRSTPGIRPCPASLSATAPGLSGSSSTARPASSASGQRARKPPWMSVGWSGSASTRAARD